MTAAAQLLLPGFCLCGDLLPEPRALPDDRCPLDVVGHQCACDRVWAADVAEGGDWWLSRGFAGDELMPDGGAR